MAAESGAAQLRFRVTDLRRRVGNRDEHDREVDLAGLRVGDAEVGDAPVRVRVVLESLSDSVLVDGEVAFDWTGVCRRCLGPAEGTATAVISEVFADRPEDDEILEIHDGSVDLGDVVRDTVLLGLPLAPLCREDCPGPAPEVFPVGVEADTEDGGPPPADPRWAALSELHLDP